MNFCNGKEGNVLFNDALNPFCLPLYDVRHMVIDYYSSKESFICTSHGLCYTSCEALVEMRNQSRRFQSDDSLHYEQMYQHLANFAVEETQ